jgi:hypothetical protein
MCTTATAATCSPALGSTISAPPLPVTAPKAPAIVTQTLVLKPRQVIRIVDHRGRPLLDVAAGENGPVLQLAEGDAGLDVSGKLRLHADAIEMIARDGELKMLAKDDVVVRGEIIRLN